ncbi:hypothetical protein A2108_02425 [Candidatus Wolfebacteria bacterium GWA1_42_9]|nr:MAG: hypothetical protein UW08_C0010G0011 [Parcubacteria group bacterium GW2011_GWB1_43_8b]OGM90225.1 MAG: hypothetical protein A2108_02425 [Candidatus Wolfebacteria bacterium GWA1_42_9]
MPEEKKIPQPPSSDPLPDEGLEIVREEIEEGGKERVAKLGHVTFREKGEQELSIEDKIGKFAEEPKISVVVDKIANLFVFSYPGDRIRLSVKDEGDPADSLKGVEGDFNNWLAGHAYEPAKPEDLHKIMEVIEARVEDAIGKKLRGEPTQMSEENLQGWLDNMRKKGYWTQFRQRLELRSTRKPN